MATAICAIVNGGNLMRPYVVAKAEDAAGNVVLENKPTVRRRVISEATSAQMRTMMQAVVDAGGGHTAQISGYRAGGKSATSQTLDSEDEKARIASFVAVAPMDNPQYLVMVCLDEPHSWSTAGGSLSAPVCAEVLEQILEYEGIPRDAALMMGQQGEPVSAGAPGVSEDGDTDDGA